MGKKIIIPSITLVIISILYLVVNTNMNNKYVNEKSGYSNFKLDSDVEKQKIPISEIGDDLLEAKNKIEEYDKYNSRAKTYETVGLRLNLTDFSAETTAVSSAWSEYNKQIVYGFDGVEALEACNQAMYVAGLQTLIDEANKQLDAYLAK